MKGGSAAVCGPSFQDAKPVANLPLGFQKAGSRVALPWLDVPRVGQTLFCSPIVEINGSFMEGPIGFVVYP